MSPNAHRHQGVAGFVAWARSLATSTKLRDGALRIWHRLHTSHLSARVVASSVGVGLAVGLLPVYGLHGVLVLAICVPLRLDSVLAFAATMVSNPLTFPLLVIAELKVGEALLGSSALSVDQLMAGQGWVLAGQQLLAGTMILASVVGAVGAGLAWVATRHWQRRARHRAADISAPVPKLDP